MGSWHVMRKATLIDEHNGTGVILEFPKLLAKNRLFFYIRFGMIQGFFYRLHQGVEAPARCNFGSRQTAEPAHTGMHIGALFDVAPERLKA